jgi:hypothetical protein
MKQFLLKLTTKIGRDRGKKNNEKNALTKIFVIGPAHMNLRFGEMNAWWDILFAVAEFLGTGSQVPLLLVIDAI